MNKEDIAAMFETDFTNPGSYKSGEYLEAQVLKRAKQIVQNERGLLVEVMKDWLKERNSPPIMLAVSVAEELKLTELIPTLEILREEIIQKKTPGIMLWEVRYVDEALRILQEK
jgi:hypothetical protein